jgi:hypothetical protein
VGRSFGPALLPAFSKGDDIDRYVLAEIWKPVLLEAGVLDGYLRATTSVAASARDFYRMEEALEAAGRAARPPGAAPRRPSPA